MVWLGIPNTSCSWRSPAISSWRGGSFVDYWLEKYVVWNGQRLGADLLHGSFSRPHPAVCGFVHGWAPVTWGTRRVGHAGRMNSSLQAPALLGCSSTSFLVQLSSARRKSSLPHLPSPTFFSRLEFFYPKVCLKPLMFPSFFIHSLDVTFTLK